MNAGVEPSSFSPLRWMTTYGTRVPSRAVANRRLLSYGLTSIGGRGVSPVSVSRPLASTDQMSGGVSQPVSPNIMPSVSAATSTAAQGAVEGQRDLADVTVTAEAAQPGDAAVEHAQVQPVTRQVQILDDPVTLRHDLHRARHCRCLHARLRTRPRGRPLLASRYSVSPSISLEVTSSSNPATGTHFAWPLSSSASGATNRRASLRTSVRSSSAWREPWNARMRGIWMRS